MSMSQDNMVCFLSVNGGRILISKSKLEEYPGSILTVLSKTDNIYSNASKGIPTTMDTDVLYKACFFYEFQRFPTKKELFEDRINSERKFKHATLDEAQTCKLFGFEKPRKCRITISQ